MTLTAIVLVLISAFTHVGWNVLGKRDHPTAAFLLVAVVLGCLCLSPSLLFWGHALAVFPLAVWRWLVVAGFFEALYYATLASAYRTGDMSVVYPLARSVPVALVACISVLLGYRAQLSLTVLAGIGLIIAGGFVLPLRTFSVRWSDYRQRATAFALLAAAGTAGYSLVDDHALRLLRAVPGLPVSPVAATLLYAFFEGVSSALWLAVWIAWRSARRAEAREVARLYLGRAWLAGFFIYFGYTLVLVAMGFVTNVSYVVAFRQISIPLGALVGVFALKEPRYRPKFAGVLIMFAGLILVGIG
ncbi:MAG: EamA family transporter [Anaerolineae bacterium]